MENIHIDPKAIELIKSFNPTGDFGFGKLMCPIMITCDYENGAWGKIDVVPYGPLLIDPAAKVLHYAQEIFEGLKAYKNDDNEVYLFRPDMNSKRFNISAKRMAMPELPEEIFVETSKLITSLCHDIVPVEVGASLYLRPFMIATEPALGVKPSDTYKYVLIASPAANYFKKPNVSVYVERETSRAAAGGTGFAKTGGNYASSLQSFGKLEGKSCDQTLWLDARDHKFVEELSGMNFMAVIGDELVTPKLTDTILGGITRDSLLSLAPALGLKPKEKSLDIDELIKLIKTGECSEAFACGTAAVITPISKLVDDSGEYVFANPEGKYSIELKIEMLLMQSGRNVSKPEWSIKVDKF
jgi:branched-chain amino acid aminotransferase